MREGKRQLRKRVGRPLPRERKREVGWLCVRERKREGKRPLCEREPKRSTRGCFEKESTR